VTTTWEDLKVQVQVEEIEVLDQLVVLLTVETKTQVTRINLVARKYKEVQI